MDERFSTQLKWSPENFRVLICSTEWIEIPERFRCKVRNSIKLFAVWLRHDGPRILHGWLDSDRGTFSFNWELKEARFLCHPFDCHPNSFTNFLISCLVVVCHPIPAALRAHPLVSHVPFHCFTADTVRLSLVSLDFDSGRVRRESWLSSCLEHGQECFRHH